MTDHVNYPGEYLENLLQKHDINASELALKIGVPKNRIYQIING